MTLREFKTGLFMDLVNKRSPADNIKKKINRKTRRK